MAQASKRAVPAKGPARSPRTFSRPFCEIRRENNIIRVSGRLQDGDYKRILAGIHQAVALNGYDDVVFDFRPCLAASPGSMVPFCAAVTALRARHHAAELLLPDDMRMRKLFINANWAHLLAPRTFDPATKVIAGQVPTTIFVNADEQQGVVNRLMDAMLAMPTGLNRQEFRAIEWALNEVTDNVLNHAQSPVGVLVQLSVLEARDRIVELVVADAGLGIPNTLRTTRPDLTDIDCLDQAIREGVTRDKNIGQGNGLFGTFQICEKSSGRLRIDSGNSSLTFDQGSGLHIRGEGIPLEGTLVDAKIGLNEQGAPSLVLMFGGREHEPVDVIENRYETDAGDRIEFILAKETTSFGSRIGARPIRAKLLNLLQMCPGQRIRVDFKGVALISSSFADEVFGRLFVELGPMTFMARIEFVSLDQTLAVLIDRAIAQRSATDLLRG